MVRDGLYEVDYHLKMEQAILFGSIKIYLSTSIQVHMKRDR